MFELEPESPVLIAYYRDHLEQHNGIADACGIPRFSKYLLRDLAQFVPDREALRLVEVVTRMGDFGNTEELISMRRAVSRQLKSRGVKTPRGKRTAPGLREFVERVAPVLLFLGLPLATGGRSKLVLALQLIASELDLRGDPRDELRRLRKLKIEREQRQRLLLKTVVAQALRQLAPYPELTPGEYLPPR